MDLRDFIKSTGWKPLQLTESEVAELACRAQIGTPLEQVLSDLREELRAVVPVAPPTGIPYRHEGAQPRREVEVEKARPVDAIRAELGQIARSQEDKAKEIQKLYEFYNQLCEEEYNSPGKTWTQLKETEFENKGGLNHYKYMRPFYYARGVLDPPRFLNDIVLDVKFLDEVGVTGGAHQALVDVFEGANKGLLKIPLIGKLLKKGVIESIPFTVTKQGKKIRVIGGWNPRPRTDNEGKPEALSPHALGFATDIKPATNEHLKGKRAEAIDAVLNYLQSAGKFPYDYRVTKPFIDYDAIEKNPDKAEEIASQMWEKLMRISAAFQGFIRENLPKHQKKQPLGPAVEKLLAECIKQFGLGKLESIAKNGLYDEHLALVVAMVGAGARYGGEFKSKDQHHFEVRNWQRRFQRPKCIEDVTKRKSKRRRPS